MRAGKPDDYPQLTPIGVYAAGARAANPIDLPQPFACLHPARVRRACIIIRICTDTKINAVDKP